MIIQHESAQPHSVKPVKNYLDTVKREVLPHETYSPDIAPSNYFLLRSLVHGPANQQLFVYEDISKRLDWWIASK